MMSEVTAEELATRVRDVVRFSLPQEGAIAVLKRGRASA